MAGEVEGAAEGGAPETPDIDNMSDAEFEEFRNAQKAGEEAPSKAKEPEAGEDEDDDDSEPVAGSQSVPHAKFHRANERRKEAEKRAEDAQRNATVAMQRMAELMEAMKGRQEPEQKAPVNEDPEPDYNEDPIGWIGWRKREDQRASEERAGQQRQWEQYQREQQEFQDTLARATARFQKVVAARPEIAQLYESVRTVAADLYAKSGVPEHQIKAKVDAYEADIIKWARKEYIPIEEALELAARQFGIQTPQGGQQPGSQLPRDPATGQFKSAQDIDKLDQTKRASRSLNGGAAVRTEGPTPEDIVNMSEEDFAAFKKKYGDKAMAKAFGVAA